MLVSRDSRRLLPDFRGVFRLMATAAILASPLAEAQVGFTPSFINGLGIGTSNNKASKVTSLQFGPDNRLYFIQVNGTVVACDVARLGPNNYQATNVEVITLVKDIPNYNDDGVRNPSVTGRQATGILVVGTPSHPVIYTTSCDPREGAGSGGTDLNLDTNSGVISRLKRNVSGVWEKVDIVRGLPRSEENHACNGLNISADGNTLYLAQGGNTNAGSPSNNFAFSCETALAAAVLSIDLPALEALPVLTDAYGQQYLYNIPTLNDPNPARADVVPADADHADVNDPFGGNDGLNQAKIVAGGPVQVHATGFRNPYDVLISAIPGRVGKMYTFDNAGNSGWGGYPKNESAPATVTNEYVPGEPGTVNNKDGLYLITGPGYYRGHPHPLRANPAGAGWLRNDEGGAGIQFSLNPTVDWPPVPVSMADPQQGDFKLPGPADGALITNSASTTGIAEYTAGNFGGAMTGDLIVTQYSAATVQRISLNAAGTAVTSSSVLLNGSTYGTPLDVTCPGPGAAPALAGTIFVGHHSSKITVLEPTDFDSGGGVCAGVFSFSLDEDGDGYSNADEISNNSDPCSPAVLPPDNDGDFLSDLLDADDDNDGIPDTQDLFAIDALNGRDVAPPVRRELFNELGIGFFSIGLKGVMLNPGENYAQRMAVDELIAGGTAGLFTDPQVGPGNPHGASNTQVNGFHFGVNVDEYTGPFLVTSRLGGLLFNGTPQAGQSQGIFIGNGDQDNYVKVAAHANSGNGGIEVVHEENGTILSQTIHPEPGLFSADTFLHFLVDPIAGTIHPGYALGGGPVTYVGSPITVSGKLLGSIRGSTAMAFGLLATTGNVGTPTFNATWDYFDVSPVAKTAAASLIVSSGTGTTLNSSTNTSGSFKLENLSTGGEKITSLKIDLRTALLPDVVFDPDHTAADDDGEAFQASSFTGTGTPTHSFEAPKNGVDGDEGYQVLHVNCSGGVLFGPGDLLTFSSDIDPTSIRGVQGPGPFHSGSVSGLEAIGATVTVTFDDGTVRKTRLGGMPGTPDVNKGATGLLSSNRLPTPSISVAGQSSPFTTATQPTVRIAGTPGAAVKLGVFRSALRLDDPTLGISTAGYDLDPYETNRVESYSFIDETIGTAGYVDVLLSLSHDEEIGGIHLVTAFIADGSGRSATSNVLTIDYDPTSSPATALFRINAGSSSSFTDTAGQVWAADVGTSTYGTTSGETTTYANPITGTEDDTLYQSFRYDGSPSSPLDFNFTVPNGTYEVRLHFAETWSGITGNGQRVFDVLAEGSTVLNDLDVFAEAGPNTVLVKTFESTVNDGLLTVGLRHGVQNPFVCGIEVFQLSASGPDEEDPTAPAILTYSNLSPGGLLLAWSQASDNSGSIAGYRIYRDAIETPIGTTASGLSLPVDNLMPETDYEFAVEAFDAAGNVSPRTTLEVTTPADTQDPTAPGLLNGVAGNELAVLSWNLSSDDTRVAEYRVFRDGYLVATVTTPGFTDSGLTNGTLYSYTVVAVDAVGKLSTPAAVSVRPRALGPAMHRIDCGLLSGSYTDLNGNVWSADTGFNSGNNNVGPTPATTVPISGTDAPEIYRNYRFKNRFSGTPLKYEFTVPDGEYELRLHFAELWTGATAPGARVFNVLVEGATALSNFDIYAQAGAINTALVKALPVTVADGKLTVDFTVVTQNPQVAGIEIFPLQEGPPDTTPPAAPANLAVSGKTESTVSLAWDAPADDAVAWVVKRGIDTLAVVSSNSYVDGGLSPDTAYTYSVTARDAANNLSAPSTVNVTTDPDSTPPGVPQNLTAAPGNGLVVLSWQAPSGEAVDHYDVFRDSVFVAAVSSTGYTDTAVVNGTSYAYEVKAVDAAGNASAAAAVTGTPQALGPAVFRINCGKLDTTYTDTLGNVWSTDAYYNPSNGSTGSTTVATSGTTAPDIYRTHRFKNRNSSTPLKYTLPLPNGSYEVRLHFAEVWTGATGPGIRVFDVLAEGSVVLNDLDIYAEAGGRDIALVKAIPVIVSDSELNLDFSVVVQNPQICGIEVFPVVGSGAGDNLAPSSPANLAATNVTATGVELGWTASTDNPGGTGVEGYRIFRRETATQTIEQAQLVATVVGTTFADTGLTQGTDYEYRVFAYDGANNASDPAVLPVTTATPDTTPPTVPSDLAAIPGPGQVELTWTASFDVGGSGLAGYRVFRDGDEIADVATPGHLNSGLFGNVAFVYEVLAYDAAGNESARAQVNATTPPDSEAPAAPRHLATLPGDASVALSWLPPVGSPDVNAYEVRRDGNLVATVGGTGYLDTGLSNGTLYTYHVRAVDTSGNDSPDVTASATPRLLGPVVARVNAGGPAYTDGLGNVWSEDGGFNLGQTSSAGSIAIAGTEDDVLYQTERYDSTPTGGDLVFSTPVANGKYEVKLHFAETFAGITAAGQRVFDVFAEEQLAIDDLDIFDRAGLNSAVVVVLPVTVNDGALDVRFGHLGIQNPKVCAIEVHAVLPNGPPTFEEWLVLHDLDGQTSGDADGGGLSNLEEYELQMDPNDASDDLAFRLTCTPEAGGKRIALPVLKPIGNYHLHRDTDLDDLGNVAHRIDTITKAEIEAMSPEERASYTVLDNSGGGRAFYQLFFEPVSE